MDLTALLAAKPRPTIHGDGIININLNGPDRLLGCFDLEDKEDKYANLSFWLKDQLERVMNTEDLNPLTKSIKNNGAMQKEMGDAMIELGNTIQVDIDYYKRENAILNAKYDQLQIASE